MRTVIIALLCGGLFGFGLSLSQMIDRHKIINFLNVTGNWDPSLLFVFVGAVGVTLFAFRWVLRRSNPICAPTFYLPDAQQIDKKLVGGAIIFGIGWGITGFCPGPAITSLVFAWQNAALFLLCMALGSFIWPRLFVVSK